VKPKSAVGEMLAYYYQAQPHLFKEVIERQFGVLAEERDAKEAAEREQKESAAAADEEGDGKPTSSMDLTLYRRARQCGTAPSGSAHGAYGWPQRAVILVKPVLHTACTAALVPPSAAPGTRRIAPRGVRVQRLVSWTSRRRGTRVAERSPQQESCRA